MFMKALKIISCDRKLRRLISFRDCKIFIHTHTFKIKAFIKVVYKIVIAFVVDHDGKF